LIILIVASPTFVLAKGMGRALLKAGALKVDVPKAVSAMVPALVAAPAFADVNAVSTMPLSLEVTFAAYLAVLLGTFVPVTFLIVLYSQVIAAFIPLGSLMVALGFTTLLSPFFPV